MEVIRDWLHSSYGILTPVEWLTACIEWLQEENGGQVVSTAQLQPLVFEQWLMSDLREIGASCLPADLANQNSAHIMGPLALQVESMLDVGLPLYGQLQKVRGTLSANSEVSGDQPQQPAWEPKPSRMLLMKMTDGQMEVEGMEYRPIPALHGGLQPGFKVLIHGDVKCRRGILMLTGDNLQVLGGEVDALVEANPPVSVLEQAMALNAANNGKHEKMGFSGHFIHKQDFSCGEQKFKAQPSTQSGCNRKQPSGIKMNSIGSASVVIKKQPASQLSLPADNEWEEDVDYGGILNSLDESEEAGTEIAEAHSRWPASDQTANLGRQPAKASIKEQKATLSEGQRRSSTTVHSQQAYFTAGRLLDKGMVQKPFMAGNNTFQKNAIAIVPKEEMLDEFDDEELLMEEPSVSVHSRFKADYVGLSAGSTGAEMFVNKIEQVKTKMKRTGPLLGADQAWDDDDDFAIAQAETETLSTVIPFQGNLNNKQFAKRQSLDEEAPSKLSRADKSTVIEQKASTDCVMLVKDNINKSKAFHDTANTGPPSLAKKVCLENNNVPQQERSCSVARVLSGGNKCPSLSLSQNLCSVYGSSLSIEENPPASKQQKLTLCLKGTSSVLPDSSDDRKRTSSALQRLPSGENVSKYLKNWSGLSPCQKADNHFFQAGDEAEMLISTAPSKSVIEEMGSNIPDTERLTVAPAAVNTDIVTKASETPLSYSQEKQRSSTNNQFHLLKDITDEILLAATTKEAATFTINGYITTLTDRLRSGRGDAWSLSCRITDGTAAMEVTISDAVLCGLIGFTAARSMSLRQEAREDSSVKDFLTQSLQKCQETLRDFTGLITVQSHTGSTKPVIVKMEQRGTKKR